MQDRAKANHDLGKDAMINHVLAKGSMVSKGSNVFPGLRFDDFP